MAVSYFPFDSMSVANPDRAADSSQLAAYIATFISDGILVSGKYALNQLVVRQTEVPSMQINVDTGACVIGGRKYYQDTVRSLTVQASDALDRIDRVVLRLNLNQEYRNIDLYILKGDAGVVPVAPALTRNNIVYELAIAELYVSANVTTITQERITDTRLNVELCGSVYNLLGEVDTSVIYERLEKAYSDFVQGLVADGSITYPKLASGLVANNITTDTEGTLLDARQGKVLWDQVITHKTSSDHDGRYYTEAEIDTKLGLKANLASPAFTGTPTAPTQTASNNSTRIATTAFVQSVISALNLDQSTTGKFILPNGLKIMWGTITCTYKSAVELGATIEFPVSFSNTAYGVVLTKHNNQPQLPMVRECTTLLKAKYVAGADIGLETITNTFSSDSAILVQWVAIGY